MVTKTQVRNGIRAVSRELHAARQLVDAGQMIEASHALERAQHAAFDAKVWARANAESRLIQTRVLPR